MTFFLLLLNQLILPLLFISILYNSKIESRSNFILMVLFSGSFVGVALIIGSQSWTSIFLGWLVGGLFLLTVIKKSRDLPKNWAFKFGKNWKQISFTGVQLLLVLMSLPIMMFGLSGYSIDNNDSVINLEFPLKDGMYIVGHGGSNSLINYHNVSKSQRYALDISKLNTAGIRAWGMYPEELERYAIFEDNLYSPCDGKVLDVNKGSKDFNPPKRGEGHPAGNHVVIECEGTQITLAHMKENSIVVDSLDFVQAGDLLGEVGNSGNTSEPHLHIHAEVDGKGIPIKFDDRFLVRNSVVWN